MRQIEALEGKLECAKFFQMTINTLRVDFSFYDWRLKFFSGRFDGYRIISWRLFLQIGASLFDEPISEKKKS